MADSGLPDSSSSVIDTSYIAYIATNRINGKQYIGITRTGLRKRWLRHMSGARSGSRTGAFQKALLKYGMAGFTVEAVASAKSWPDLCAVECALIAQYKTLKPNGYNLTNGGEGISGCKRSPDVYERAASKNRGRVHTAEARALISAAGKGRVWSPESRAKNSAKHSGKKLTEEHRRKLSLAKIGKKRPPRSDEHSAKIAAGLRAAWARRKVASHAL